MRSYCNTSRGYRNTNIHQRGVCCGQRRLRVAPTSNLVTCHDQPLLGYFAESMLINWATGLPPLRLVGRIASRAGWHSIYVLTDHGSVHHMRVGLLTSAVVSKAKAILARFMTDQWSDQLASFKNRFFAQRGSCFSTWRTGRADSVRILWRHVPPGARVTGKSSERCFSRDIKQGNIKSGSVKPRSKLTGKVS